MFSQQMTHKAEHLCVTLWLSTRILSKDVNTPLPVHPTWSDWWLYIDMDSHAVLVTWGWGRRRRYPAASASALSGTADWPASEPVWWHSGTSSCCRAGLRFGPPDPGPPSSSPVPASQTGSVWYTADDSRIKILGSTAGRHTVIGTIRGTEWSQFHSLKQVKISIICVVSLGYSSVFSQHLNKLTDKDWDLGWEEKQGEVGQKKKN